MITIAVASAAIGLGVLLYLLWTQRRRYKQARSLAEETVRQLLEIERAGKIGHWFLDEAAQTTAWSAQMFELAGIPPKNRMLRTGVERGMFAVEGDPEEWVGRTLEWHRATGEPLERQRPDGRWTRLTERRTRDGGIVGIRTDITQLKQAEAALKATQQQLIDAIELKGSCCSITKTVTC